MNILITTHRLLSGCAPVLYTGIMPMYLSRLMASRIIRNLLAIVGTAILTFIVFQGVAAFNDALKIYGSVPVVPAFQGYSCPQGYALVTNKSGNQECIPAPSQTKGVVSVGITAPSAATKPANPPK